VDLIDIQWFRSTLPSASRVFPLSHWSAWMRVVALRFSMASLAVVALILLMLESGPFAVWLG